MHCSLFSTHPWLNKFTLSYSKLIAHLLQMGRFVYHACELPCFSVLHRFNYKLFKTKEKNKSIYIVIQLSHNDYIQVLKTIINVWSRITNVYTSTHRDPITGIMYTNQNEYNNNEHTYSCTRFLVPYIQMLAITWINTNKRKK